MIRVHGHEHAVRFLQEGLRQDRLHHAYLLSGPAHVGKTALAVQLAQAVNCGEDDPPCGQCASCQRIAQGFHTDIRTIGLETTDEGSHTLIGIDAIRQLHESAYLRPYEGKSRVFIIQDAHRLSAEAANALLKVLEEPPANVLLLLLTSAPDHVLSTIASRCQQLELQPLPVDQVALLLQEEHHLPLDQAANLARLSRGCIGWAVEASQDPTLLARLHQQLERVGDVCYAGLEGRFAYADELASRFQRDPALGRSELYLWLNWWRDILLIQQGRGQEISYRTWQETLEGQARALSSAQTVVWIEQLYMTLEALEYNAGPRLALEGLMLELPPLVRSKSSDDHSPA